MVEPTEDAEAVEETALAEAVEDATPEAEAAAPEAETAAPEAESSEETAEGKQRRKRQQANRVLGIDIPPARCCTHFKGALGRDPNMDNQMKELRKRIKAAATDEEKKTLKEELKQLSSGQTRLSVNTSTAGAVISEYMVKELLSHGMAQAVSGEKTMLEVKHLHEGSVKTLVTYPLFQNLPSWVNYSPEGESAIKARQAAENKKHKQAAEAKKTAEAKKAEPKKAPKAEAAKKGAPKKAEPKKAAEAPKKAETKKVETKKAEPKKAAEAAKKAEPKKVETKTAKKAVEVTDDADSDDAKTGGKTGFKSYIDAAITSIHTAAPEYADLRTAMRVREVLSDLVIELLKHISHLGAIHVRDEEIRTLSPKIIKTIIRILLANYGQDPNESLELFKLIDVKLEAFAEHKKAEAALKTQNLTEEKKAALAAAKAKKETAKQVKAIEKAKKSEEAARLKAQEAEKKLQEMGAGEAENGSGDAEAENGVTE